MLKRHQDWPNRLEQALAVAQREPFRWGEHDCALAACKVIEAMTGTNPGHVFVGAYDDELSAAKRMAHFAGTLEDVVARLAEEFGLPEVGALYARRGDVVLADLERGPSLGAVDLTGHRAAFAGARGLVLIPIGDCRRAWRVG